VRHPERITRKGGTVVWQVRGPRPGGGTQYMFFNTKQEASAYAAEQHTARTGGATLKARVTFESLVDEFRASHYGSLRPSAAKDYDLTFKRAGKHLGGKLLRAITAKDIEAARDATLAAIRLRNPQGGTLSVNKMITGLRTLLKFAQARGYLMTNVALHAKKLKPRPVHDRPMDSAVLTPAEVAALIAATAPEWRAAMSVLAYGGLRIGELLGLQWGDVELDRARILVRRQMCDVSREFREPKTRAGVRFIELPPTTIKELREWKIGSPKGALDLCFPNSDGGPADAHNFGNRVFAPALRRAGLRRIRVHDLRHGCASYLIASGADIASVSKQLGHSNVSTTLSIYSHWFQQRTETGLGSRLAAYLKAQEEDGCGMVARGAVDSRKSA
jgi:integrase